MGILTSKVGQTDLVFSCDRGSLVGLCTRVSLCSRYELCNQPSSQLLFENHKLKSLIPICTTFISEINFLFDSSSPALISLLHFRFLHHHHSKHPSHLHSPFQAETYLLHKFFPPQIHTPINRADITDFWRLFGFPMLNGFYFSFLHFICFYRATQLC